MDILDTKLETLENALKYFGDIEKLEHVMDSVTSDEFVINTGYKFLADRLQDICTRHYASRDWCWAEVIEYFNKDEWKLAEKKLAEEA